MNLLRKLFRTPESVDFSEHLPSYNPEKSSTSTFKSKLSSTDIEPELLESFKSDFLASPQSELAQTAIPNATLVNLLTDRNAVIRNPHVFSDKLKLDPNVTNQNSSGICWIYAGTIKFNFSDQYSSITIHE